MYGYAKNSVSTICNGIFSNTSVIIIRSDLVKVSKTERNTTLILFDHNLAILTGSSMTDIELNNDYFISI